MYKTLRKITQILYSFSLIVALALGPLVSLALPQQVEAAFQPCSEKGVIVTSGNIGPQGTDIAYAEGEITSITVDMDVSGLKTGTYRADLFDSNHVGASPIDRTQPFTVDANTKTASITFTNPKGFNIDIYSEVLNKDTKYIHLFVGNNIASHCELGRYHITNQVLTCTEPIKVTQVRDTDGDPSTPPLECVANNASSCVDTSSDFTVSVKGLVGRNGQPYSGKVTLQGPALGTFYQDTTAPGELTFTRGFREGTHSISLGGWPTGTKFEGPCTANIEVKGRCNVGDSCSEKFNPTVPGGTTGGDTYELCAQIGDQTPAGEAMKKNCTDCNEKNGVWTAVGCIERDPKSIVARFLEIGLGLGGGVCLLTCLAGGFMITTSQGEPKKINDAKEMITNALIGLLFIIFSVTLLQFIGVTIFNIPGFGTTTP